MQPGDVLGKAYRIERALGAGGVGAVFEVTQLRTGRRYALKTLLPEMALRHGARERFQREAEVLASMGHAGIVSIHDFDTEADGTQFLVMDLLDGEDLSTRIAKVGALDLKTALRVMEEVASALAAAHARGIVHRDLKPANVFLTTREGAEERAMILDFGLAKNASNDSLHLTATGVGVGTPLYMSPEQARGAEVDARTDVYALGTILYEMLVGEAPFIGPSLTAVIAQLLTDPPPRLSEHAAKPTPWMLDAVIEKALAKAPDDRYATVQALMEAVRAASGSSSERALANTALPPPPSSETRPRSKDAVPMTRVDLSAREVDAISASTPRRDALSTMRPMPAPSLQEPAAKASTSPVLWMALGMMTTLTVVMGGFLAYTHLTTTTPLPEPEAAVVRSEPAQETTPTEAPPTPAEAPVATTVEVPVAQAEVTSAQPRRRVANTAAETPEPATQAPPAAPPTVPPTTPEGASLEEQARGLLATLPPDRQAAFRAAGSATARSYETQIANNERRIQQWQALIQDVVTLRREARTLANGQNPDSCTSALRQRLVANTRSDEGMVASTSRGLEESLDRICTRFDEWNAPPAESTRRFEAIASALTRSETMLTESPARAAPPADLSTVQSALAAFRRLHARQPATFARYPCSDQAVTDLATAGDVSHAWCAAAADGVQRRVLEACRSVGMDAQSLAQQSRILASQTEAAESNLRSTITMYEDMNATLRSSIAHTNAISQ